MKLLKYLLLIISIFCTYLWNVNANINLTVSPIRYEIDTSTWSVVTKTATLFNRSNETHTIITWKSDFESKDTSWNPKFVRRSELVFSDQELSSWISIDTNSFTILPWEKKEISFTITVPDNATPWWHYWAVFFKNNNSEWSSWTKVGINVDYWVLLLVKVDWEIITEGNVEDTIVKIGWWVWIAALIMDDCPVIDLTKSRYDWKCIDDFFDKEDLKEDIDDLNLDNLSDLELSDFNINFETLFINEWNTHLKPKWNITLIDENWKEIKWIWKEIIKNEHWAIIWEKIVDYLPINDNDGNVLPWTNRNFIADWKWFPYEWYDETWKKIIKYWTPSEYYSRKNKDEKWYIFPWERENERINHEKINANVKISYINKDGEEVEFNSAEEFYVDYKEKYIWLNPYAFILFWFVIIISFLLWLICRKKKIKCSNCNKKLDKDMKICPYCGTKQKKKWKKKK